MKIVTNVKLTTAGLDVVPVEVGLGAQHREGVSTGRTGQAGQSEEACGARGWSREAGVRHHRDGRRMRGVRQLLRVHLLLQAESRVAR